MWPRGTEPLRIKTVVVEEITKITTDPARAEKQRKRQSIRRERGGEGREDKNICGWTGANGRAEGPVFIVGPTARGNECNHKRIKTSGSH